MIAAMRQRLLVALGLTGAVAPNIGCYGGDGELRPTAVDYEFKRQLPEPDPAPLPKKRWVPEPIAFQHGGTSCAAASFCTTVPEVTKFNYADACGTLAKIPEGVGADDREGNEAGFNPHVTNEERKNTNEPEACCYSYLRGACGKGRPMRNEGDLVIASEVAREGWSTLDASEIAADVRTHASSEELERLTQHLRKVALFEHASVAAFARVSLELMAFGAPAELVSAAHVAALDEVRHARLCWSLLEALEGSARGPGPMTIPPIVVDRNEALISTIVDGCIGETVGSLLLQEAAHVCTVPSLAAMYRAIADDEAEHAALAFRIVRFLAPEDPISIARAHVFESEPVEPLPRLGILSEETEKTIEARAVAELVLPLLAGLTSAEAAQTVS
jgi:hypothetical protein